MRFSRHVPAAALVAALFIPQAQAAPPPRQQAARAKENKADLAANVASNREVIQMLERSKKMLLAQKGKDAGAHRANAIRHIQEAMGEIRAETSKPGH